jgi:hypothetical protein
MLAVHSEVIEMSDKAPPERGMLSTNREVTMATTPLGDRQKRPS